MSTLKVLRNSGIYTIVNLLQKGINFLLIPILTTYLTTFDYGVVAVVTAINAFLNVFYLLSLNGCLNRFYYEFEYDEEKKRQLFGTVLSFVFFFSLFLTLLLVVFHSVILDPFLDRVEFYPYMALGMISVLFNPVFTISQNILQAKQEAKKYGANNLAFFLVNLTLLLFSVVVLDLGAKGVLGSLAITNIVFFVFTLFHIRDKIQIGFNINLLNKALKYALPLVPHSLSAVATSIIDRLFINNMLSTAIAGIYTLGSTFGSIVFLIGSGVNQAFVPWFNKKVKSNDISSIPELARALIMLYSLAALGISFFGKEIIAMITPTAYHNAWEIIPFIAFAYVLHGSYYFYSTPFFYDMTGKGSRTLPLFTISAALINILLNYLLIGLYGMLGAAISTMIAKLFLVFSLSYKYKSFVQIQFDRIALILIPLLFFVISLISFLTLEPNFLFVIKTATFLIAILFGLLFYRKRIPLMIELFKRNKSKPGSK